MGMLNIDEHVEEHRVLAIRYPDKAVMLGQIIPFTNFAPRLLASLVASSTAACTSGVVTVTAAAHGIPATIFDGMQFYYPGSPSLAAGWYSGFARTSADALTFLEPTAANFTSESVNSGNAFVDEVTAASISLPPNTLNAGDIVSITTFARGDGVSSAKTWRIKTGTTTLSSQAVSTGTSQGIINLGFCVTSSVQAIGAAIRSHSLVSSSTSATIDTSAVTTVSLSLQLAAAGMFIFLPSAKLEIK